jgi:hypothetical protein
MPLSDGQHRTSLSLEWIGHLQRFRRAATTSLRSSTIFASSGFDFKLSSKLEKAAADAFCGLFDVKEQNQMYQMYLVPATSTSLA